MDKPITGKGIIGILAGMGPRSTAPFINLVIDECQRQYGAKEDIDFPKIMIYSLPTPFYAHLPVDHAAMTKTLCEGLKTLESSGVFFAAIACNTAHVYYPELAQSIKIPLLNIVELTLNKLKNDNQRVAVLASRSTIESNIYQQGIFQCGYEFVEINWQSKVDQLIESLKTPQEDPFFFQKAWAQLLFLANDADVDTIIIACLDLSVIKTYIASKDLHIIDSSDCLAQAIVKQWLKHAIS